MVKQKVVIGITGGIGSGKGTVTQYLKERYEAGGVAYTDILKDILERLYLANKRKNLAVLAESLRNGFGKDVLSVVLEKEIKNKKASLIVFDGIRKKEEMEYFKSKINNFFFVFVDTPIEISYQRLIKRGEKTDDNSKTFAEFKKDQLCPADKDVPSLKKMADFVINNGGSLEKTYKQIDEMMGGLKVI